MTTRPGKVARGVLTLSVLASAGLVCAVAADRGAAATSAVFPDCASFTAHMRDLTRPELTPYGFGGGDMDALAGPGAAFHPTTARLGGSTEVPGLGTSDSVQVDGDRVVVLGWRGDRTILDILEVAGSKPVRLGSWTLPAGQGPREFLLLPRHRALLIGWANEGENRKGPPIAPVSREPVEGRPPLVEPEPREAWSTNQTVLTLVDLADPARPAVLGSEKITGSLISAGVHDGVARVVLNHEPRLALLRPPTDVPYATEPETTEPALAHNRAVVAAADENAWLPTREVLDAAGHVVSRGSLLACAEVRRPARPVGLGIVSVLTLDGAASDVLGSGGASAVAAGDGLVVHSSSDRLYVGAVRGDWRSEEADALSTTIHAFDVTGRAGSRYLGSATVPGYAFDGDYAESGALLRIAATEGSPSARNGRGAAAGTSAVTVLAESDDGLEQVGAVTGLGRGERLGATRWSDRLVAVATADDDETMHLIDVSAEDPRVLGELSYPGHTGSLHAVDEGRLLGVGTDGPPDGRPHRVQVGSLDVSDPATPRRTDVLELGPGHDPTVALYLPGRRLLVVAVDEPAKGLPRGEKGVSSRLYAVAVDADGQLHKRAELLVDGGVERLLVVGDRLLAVGDELSVLDAPNLRVLGSLAAAPARWQLAGR